MKLLEALAHMHDDKRITAARIPPQKGRGTQDTALVEREQFEKGKRGLFLNTADLTSNKWEVGFTCEVCWGEGETQGPCKTCRGTGMVGGDICCGGLDSYKCEGEEGKPCEGGIYWTDTY